MSWLDDLLYGYRTIRNALGADSTTRAVLKIIGATVADDPTTGATIITIAGGTPLATLTGTGFVHVNSSDPQNPVVSLSPAPTAAATPETLVARDASGDAFFADVYASNGFIATASGALDLHQATAIAGDGADGLIKAQSGTQSGNHDGGELLLSGGDGHGTGTGGGAALQVASTTVLRVGPEPALGGANAVYVGSSGSNAALVIPDDVLEFEVARLPRATSGNAHGLGISGQDATNGNGGDLNFSAGAKGGSGTQHGAMDFSSGGVSLIRLFSGVATLGNTSNSSTPSVKIAGPTTLTPGGDGAADAMPSHPEAYLEVLKGSTSYLIPLIKKA